MRFFKGMKGGIDLNKSMIGILSILVLVVLVSGCSSTNSANHYSSKDTTGKEISFDYPNGWTFEDRAAGIVIQGEKNDTNITTVTISKLPAGSSSLETLKNNSTLVRTGTIVSETNRTVDGVTAKEITLNQVAGAAIGKIGEAKVVIYIKNGNVYTISFFTGDTIQNIQDDIDTIVNSFKAT